ncbi:MAG: hypothetical protein COV45_04065 [Deltaproteobacteria bacterium CG11_big_fil_rev_8_21_14_0_20_47_16]|nr:MAG: hypothetical protein COV45_04065 [Deltaproteobacteria bacterium CG11_big_fil_rev_8_21_14_0_20_47_16]
MKKIIAIAVAAAVMGVSYVSFADLGNTMQNAASKTADKAADKATDKATDAAAKKATDAVADKAQPADTDAQVAKKAKKKKVAE